MAPEDKAAPTPAAPEQTSEPKAPESLPAGVPDIEPEATPPHKPEHSRARKVLESLGGGTALILALLQWVVEMSTGLRVAIWGVVAALSAHLAWTHLKSRWRWAGSVAAVLVVAGLGWWNLTRASPDELTPESIADAVVKRLSPPDKHATASETKSPSGQPETTAKPSIPSSVQSAPRKAAPLPQSKLLVAAAARIEAARIAAEAGKRAYEAELKLNEDISALEEDIYMAHDRSKYVLDWRLPSGLALVAREEYEGPKQFHALTATEPDCWTWPPDPDWTRAEVRGWGRRLLATSPLELTYYDAYGPVSFIEVNDARDGLVAEINFEANKSFWSDVPSGWLQAPWFVSENSHKIILGTLCDDRPTRRQELRFWSSTVLNGKRMIAPTTRMSWQVDPSVTSTANKTFKLPAITLRIRIMDGGRLLQEQQLVIQPNRPQVGLSPLVAWQRK